MTTIHVVLDSTLPPHKALEAARDFSPQRAQMFPAVSVKRLQVHELGATSADVTEGTRAGPVVNWERCHYDWSQPDTLTATVTDSNVYALPSSWKITATATPDGSRIEMWWIREFRRGPRGRIFETAFRLVGNKIFTRYARQTIQNIERLSTAGPHHPAGPTPVYASTTPQDQGVALLPHQRH